MSDRELNAWHQQEVQTHLGACVSLLAIVGERHRVELPYGVIALQDHRRILPCDGRPCLHLPRKDRHQPDGKEAKQQTTRSMSPPTNGVLTCASIKWLPVLMLFLGTLSNCLQRT